MNPSRPDDKNDDRSIERWFIRRGVPHFIDDYSAGEDIFTRAAPFLTLVFLLEIAAAANFSAWWTNTLAVVGGAALLVGIWALFNRARGRKPLSLPQSIGRVELAIFILAPPLLPLIFGGDGSTAALVIGVNIATLAVVYLVTSYGLIPITIWATRRLFDQVAGTVRLLARALPLLLLAITFLFINAEVWQTAGSLVGPLFVGTLALFTVIGALFAIVRLPREIGQLSQFDSWVEMAPLLEQTPLAGQQIGVEGEPDPTPLDWREWTNVGLVVLFAQAVQVLLVVAMVGAFLVLLGLLLVPTSVIQVWGGEPNVLLTLSLLGRDVELTEELLRVSGFLAAFSGLYFAVAAVTDANYREEFFSEVIGDVRQAMAVRAVYRELLGRQ